jgi:hypothetical protein
MKVREVNIAGILSSSADTLVRRSVRDGRCKHGLGMPESRFEKVIVGTLIFSMTPSKIKVYHVKATARHCCLEETPDTCTYHNDTLLRSKFLCH